MIERIKRITKTNFDKIDVPDDYEKRSITKNSDKNLVLIGMRRLGKTEYLNYRIIKSQVKEDELIYINFDSYALTDIELNRTDGKTYELINTITSMLSLGKIKLVVLDEIQKLKNWSIILKSMIDDFKDVSFIASGSDSTELLKSREMGIGRFSVKFIGPYMFSEYVKTHGDNFIDYIDNYSFPQGPKLEDDEKYSRVLEIQIATTKISKVNILAAFRAIALNPGSRMTSNKLATIMKEMTDSRVDSKQVKPILKFLIDSQLIISLPDKHTFDRISHKTSFTLYPLDWNSYKFFSSNTKYEDKPTKIGESKEKDLPTKGFIFENMIISNVYSSLRTMLDKDKLFNKTSEPDVDFILGNESYEIKSFDVFNAGDEILINIINKAKETGASIIHTGDTKEIQGISFVNHLEFLKNL